MTINNILIKSSIAFNQRDYLEKCDLLNKYLVKNIYEIPGCSSITIKYKKVISCFLLIIIYYILTI